jgi:hypothetical protein
LGIWELSTIALGKCVNQERQAKGRKFVWVGTTVLGHSVFVHEQQVERRKKSLELELPWRENSKACWSILELKIEEPGCHD